MKYRLLILLPLFFASVYLRCATANIIGGDITWDNPNGANYIFKLRLFVQCGGPAVPVTQTINIFNHPVMTSFNLNLVSSRDISPVCSSSGTTINCISAGPGAVTEYVYESIPSIVGGVPPPGGWVLTYSDCCRNTNTNLSTTSNSGITLWSKIYPYNNMNTNNYIDNSADFLIDPMTIVCNGTANTLNFGAIDPDLDSVSFDWGNPLDDFTGGGFNPPVSPAPISYNAGFSSSSPFPSASMGAGNVGAQLDPRTGDVNYTSALTGDYTYGIVYSSWRCGQKVSEVYREFQVHFSNCGINTPPTVTAPFGGGLYETTVPAGTLINFTMNAATGNNQTIIWEAYGDEFGANFTNASSGCTQAPCATLNPAPPSANNGTNSITFNWQTDCSHLSNGSACSLGNRTFRYYIIAKNDSCPIPAVNFKTILIHLTAPTVLASPEIRCASVDAANNLTLTWATPPDPFNTFVNYQLFSAPTLNGQYDSLTTVSTYAQTQYTIPAAFGMLSKYYYIRSFGCGGYIGSDPVDTVHAIILNVANPANGTATLNWNTFVNPLPATSCGIYKIWKEFPAGTWTLIDSTTTLTYVDTISVCSQQINYRVDICDQSGCISSSTIDGDIFQDQVDPVIPALDSVSVDASGNAILGWTASTSADVVAYIVYQSVSGVNVPIDTVYGINNTFFTNNGSFADAGSESYLIAAFDSCNNLSNITPLQSTIYLSKQYSVCNFYATLSWTAYVNMGDGGLDHYELYVSVNGGPFILLSISNSTSYQHINLVPGNSYCYKVRAVSAGGLLSSTSNRQCVVASAVANSPQYLYISRVTVNNSQTVDVDCFIDNSPTVTIKGIDLYKSSTYAGPYTIANNISYSGAASYTITDTDVEVNKSNYFYYAVARDSCDNASISSDTSKTILCKAWPNENFTNTIIWNDYDMWLGGITSYNIYRSVNGSFSPAPIANITYTGAGTYSYTDDVQFNTAEDGQFVYYIEALEGTGNTYGFSETSNSNYAHVYRDADIFVPNAFAPRGRNTIFYPVTQYVSKSDYRFMIFNRWGQKIWETTDDTAGWDGGGDEGGVYVWTIQFKNSKGEFIERRGSVTLVR